MRTYRRRQCSEVIAGNGRVYVQFTSMNYEIPIIDNKSKAAYVSGVYALDANGRLIWSKTISPSARDMRVVNNSTIMYRNGNGNLVVTNGRCSWLRPYHIFVYLHPVHLSWRDRPRP